eukprot:CAMPEP_0201281000 /NCGR_PEP_ID=MMETSP1317-20130820/766_1 /ASSEMBLY_ACC=CAM_ASM_000770 /TAXON_ID=187299 /ORGANISM="Undescribed Undescribed, Strain Undescribed" /LENGTH=107 /DNA_ID=CAMNT_0047589697 /DNA_START=230 /DNA_END=552 /DNA_ORIENTATION=+
MWKDLLASRKSCNRGKLGGVYYTVAEGDELTISPDLVMNDKYDLLDVSFTSGESGYYTTYGIYTKYWHFTSDADTASFTPETETLSIYLMLNMDDDYFQLENGECSY